jgi:hypothetical protein
MMQAAAGTRFGLVLAYQVQSYLKCRWGLPVRQLCLPPSGFSRQRQLTISLKLADASQAVCIFSLHHIRRI